MSWLKENYEKAALGGAAIIALGVGALILTSNVGDITEVQNPPRVNSFEVPEQEILDENVKALAKTGTVTYQQHLESDLYSFIAYPTYGVKGSEGIDEIGPDTLLHDIPLKWWKQYGLDDYQFSRGGERDSDNDGYTNKEEYDAQTDPTKLDSRPELTRKLQLLDSKSTHYRMQWSRIDDARANFTFTLRGRTSNDFCGVGDTFPTKDHPEEFINRFKVKMKGIGMNPTTNFEESFYEVEDTKKAGFIYKMWRSDGPRKCLDWTVKLKLNTPDGGEAFLVPENGEFSLPYKEGGKGYRFKFDPNRDPKLKKIEKIQLEGANGVIPLGLAPPEAEQPEQPEGNENIVPL